MLVSFVRLAAPPATCVLFIDEDFNASNLPGGQSRATRRIAWLACHKDTPSHYENHMQTSAQARDRSMSEAHTFAGCVYAVLRTEVWPRTDARRFYVNDSVWPITVLARVAFD
jgi:hypothetical protein